MENLIHVIRQQKVMLDSTLAGLYGVQTKALNLAVRRNLTRFPEDFVFQLDEKESENLRLQIETSSGAWGGRRYQPYAFTEQGVAMLSSVLRSERAVQMNVAIMRAFVRMRRIVATNKEMGARIEKLQKSHAQTASVIEMLVHDIDQIERDLQELKALPPVSRKKIGFHLTESAGSRK